MKIIKNSIWSATGLGLPIVSALISIPYLSAQLTSEEFGVLVLLWTLTGYMALFDLGMGRMLTIILPGLNESEKEKQTELNITAAVVMSACVGSVSGFIVFFNAPFICGILIDTEEILYFDSIYALRVISFAIPFISCTATIRGALEGINRFPRSNVNKSLGGMFNFIVPCVLIISGHDGLVKMAIGIFIYRIVLFLDVFFSIRKYLKSNLVDIKEKISPLLLNGKWLTLSSIIGPIMVYGDRFILTNAIGVASLGYYYIPQEIFTKFTLVISAISGALLPHLSGMTKEQSIRYFLKINNLLYVLSGSVCFLGALLAYPFLVYWMDQSFAEIASPIGLIIIIGVFFNSVSMGYYTFLHSLGRIRLTALFHLFELILFIPMVYFFSKEFGLKGAALAWSIRCLIDYFLLKVATKFMQKI